ncbi:MAG: GxxExxY protein [Flavobacteriales bacterium]|nr:GxxExxY protein [Flavobacteriales bacterium]
MNGWRADGELTREHQLDPRHQRSIDQAEYPHSELTQKIIAAFFKVYNTLGYGFLEKVYENAMVVELRSKGIEVKVQHPITVAYEGIQVGSYYADLFVEDQVIVELKAAEDICEEHEFQLVNYLKATNKEIGLLLNFGIRPRIKRKIHARHYQR